MTETPAPRRFYQNVDVAAHGAGYRVALDGRTLRTPAKSEFVTPTQALARACAAEWRAQANEIRPETMPITRLVNVAIDRAGATRAELVARVAKYGETDLLCHRSTSPRSLTALEREKWDPLLAWGRATLGAPLVKVVGVLPHTQPPEALAALERAAEALDDFRLTGLAHAAGLSGSAIIAFALAHGAIDADAAYEAAALDELHQIANWGEDEEARRRLDHLHAELKALRTYFEALD